MVTDSVARTFFLKIPNFRPKNHKNHEQKEKSSGNTSTFPSLSYYDGNQG